MTEYTIKNAIVTVTNIETWLDRIRRFINDIIDDANITHADSLIISTNFRRERAYDLNNFNLDNYIVDLRKSINSLFKSLNDDEIVFVIHIRSEIDV